MRKNKEYREVKVWDFFIRVFHWTLVLSFTITYLSGDEENQLHIYFGYVIGFLVIFRVIWGLIGSKYARFSNFIHSPAKVISYLISLKSKAPIHYMGHNPAGGYMIIMLLFMLTVTTFTGLQAYGAKGHGPLANNFVGIALITEAYARRGRHGDDDHRQRNEEEDEFWEEMHEASANVTVFLIIIHILGVIVSSIKHKENLVKSMITGEKYR